MGKIKRFANTMFKLCPDAVRNATLLLFNYGSASRHGSAVNRAQYKHLTLAASLTNIAYMTDMIRSTNNEA